VAASVVLVIVALSAGRLIAAGHRAVAFAVFFAAWPGRTPPRVNGALLAYRAASGLAPCTPR